MNHPAPVFAILALASGLTAQTVSASLTALAPASVQCTSGAQSVGNSLPAGPLGSAYNSTANIGQGSATQLHATVDGFMVGGDQQVQVTATNFLYGAGVGTVQTASANQDLLVQLSATSAAPVQIAVSLNLQLSAGLSAPLLEIDVGNDGQVDWIAAFGSGPLGNFVLGTQPLPIRMRLVSSLPVGPTSPILQSTAAITLYVRPDNQVDVTQNVVGCVGSANSMEPPAPVFDGRGVDIITSPSVIVIGFGTQPTLLGPQSPLPFLAGCLLMPTPDVLSWEFDGQLRLLLPPAVRPVTLNVQAVLVGPVFALTDGYRIHAY